MADAIGQTASDLRKLPHAILLYCARRIRFGFKAKLDIAERNRTSSSTWVGSGPICHVLE